MIMRGHVMGSKERAVDREGLASKGRIANAKSELKGKNNVI